MERNRKYDTWKIGNILNQIDGLIKELIYTLDSDNKKIDSIDIEFWPKHDDHSTIRFWNGKKRDYLFTDFSTHWSKVNLYTEDVIKYMKSREILFRKFK